MELQQLRYVVSVAEHLSFTRAAQECHVVQSALSHQVAILEREVGTRLFARTSRQVRLTSAGEAFLGPARDCLAAADRAVEEAAAAAAQVRGLLRIGAIPTVTGLDLPAALRRFGRLHPGVQVALGVGGSDDLVRAVREGVTDVAVLGLPAGEVPRGVASRALHSERLVAVVPAAHRLGERRRVSLEDLAEETFADFPAGSPGRGQSDAAFATAGLARRVGFEVEAASVMLDLVREGLALALLPRGIVPDALQGPERGLRVLSVTRGPSRTVHLAWDDFNPSPAARAFVALLL